MDTQVDTSVVGLGVPTGASCILAPSGVAFERLQAATDRGDDIRPVSRDTVATKRPRKIPRVSHQRPRRMPRNEERAPSKELRLALAQLPGRLVEASAQFRMLTGFTAVTTVMSPVNDAGGPAVISPPMHPTCASRLHATRDTPPCEKEWQEHLRTGARDGSVRSHTCPLGLVCSCVPIHYGETLVGVAKCVAGPRTTERRFSRAVQTLELVVSKTCQDFQVSAMSRQIRILRERIGQLQEIRHVAGATRSTATTGVGAHAGAGPELLGDSLIDQTLDHIARHYLEPNLTLAGISRALGVNGKYLTRLFSQAVGQHMRIYIQLLRVQHACRLILATDKPVKHVAFESGFRRVDVFRRTFRQYTGVPPGMYRRAFVRT